jgi:hypothetical protein
MRMWPNEALWLSAAAVCHAPQDAGVMSLLEIGHASVLVCIAGVYASIATHVTKVGNTYAKGRDDDRPMYVYKCKSCPCLRLKVHLRRMI